MRRRAPPHCRERRHGSARDGVGGGRRDGGYCEPTQGRVRRMLNRRLLLTGSGAALAAAALGLPPAARAGTTLKFGAPAPFSFETLTREAEGLAARAYEPPASPSAEVLNRLDYDALGRIRFDPQAALFRDGPGAYPATFFHLGKFFPTPVRMYMLSAGQGAAQAREILYDPDYFCMPADCPAHELPRDAGICRLPLPGEPRGTSASSTGARTIGWPFSAPPTSAPSASCTSTVCRRAGSRSISPRRSPRGIPGFHALLLRAPRARAADMRSSSTRCSRAEHRRRCRFAMTRGKAVVMEIERALFLRREVSRLGIAPLTSMYWFSETMKPTAIDWRPEVHDSDGLAMWTGAGEHIWRPLNNPPHDRRLRLRRQNPQRLRPVAARPRVRSLSRRRLLRSPPEPVGRAAG